MKAKEFIKTKPLKKTNSDQIPLELPSSLKILVTGDTGAGKSTMATALSEHFGIPVFYTDLFMFKDSYTYRPYNEFKEKVIEIIESNVSYILDGCSFGSDMGLFKKAAEDADIILNFDYPAHTTVINFIKRAEAIENKKTTHLGMYVNDDYSASKQFLVFLKYYTDFIEEKEKRKNIFKDMPNKIITIYNHDDANNVRKNLIERNFTKTKDGINFLFNYNPFKLS